MVRERSSSLSSITRTRSRRYMALPRGRHGWSSPLGAERRNTRLLGEPSGLDQRYKLGVNQQATMVSHGMFGGNRRWIGGASHGKTRGRDRCTARRACYQSCAPYRMRVPACAGNLEGQLLFTRTIRAIYSSASPEGALLCPVVCPSQTSSYGYHHDGRRRLLSRQP
jgi:hypothetical protein